MEWINSHSLIIYIIGIPVTYIVSIFIVVMFGKEKNPDILVYILLSFLWPLFLFIFSVVGIFYATFWTIYKVCNIFGIK